MADHSLHVVCRWCTITHGQPWQRAGWWLGVGQPWRPGGAHQRWLQQWAVMWAPASPLLKRLVTTWHSLRVRTQDILHPSLILYPSLPSPVLLAPCITPAPLIMLAPFPDSSTLINRNILLLVWFHSCKIFFPYQVLSVHCASTCLLSVSMIMHVFYA